MFRRLEIVAVGAALLLAAAAGVVLLRAWPDDSHERQRQSLVTFQLRRDAQVDAGHWLIFGDSHVQGLCAGCLDFPAHAYGIGRETSLELVERLALYPSLRAAAGIVAITGTNDILQGRASRPAVLIDLLGRSPDRPVIVYGVFEVTAAREGADEINERIASWNLELETACATVPACRFVELEFEPDERLADGLHLNTAGYRRLLDSINTVHAASAGKPLD